MTQFSAQLGIVGAALLLCIQVNVVSATSRPKTTQMQKLTASDAEAWDSFGSAVSLSFDGQYALIAAVVRSSSKMISCIQGEDTMGYSSGAVYMFSLAYTGMYEQTQKLFASDGDSGDSFGNGIAISGDGQYALIGANGVDSLLGAAYVFGRNESGHLVERQKLKPNASVSDNQFGYSVALSGNGQYALIGAKEVDVEGDDEVEYDAGAVYVFNQTESGYTQLQKLMASDAHGSNEFGTSVAISSDGQYALIGSPREGTMGLNAGAVYVFVRSNVTGHFYEFSKLIPHDGAAQAHFGASVALSSDAQYALVGTYANSAYIFHHTPTEYIQIDRLSASDGHADDYFGSGVSISGDGQYVLIGAHNCRAGSGAAYVFGRNISGHFIQLQKTIATDSGPNSYFGRSVWLSDDVSVVLVGAPSEDERADNAGAAYIVSPSIPPIPVITPPPTEHPASYLVPVVVSVVVFILLMLVIWRWRRRRYVFHRNSN